MFRNIQFTINKRKVSFDFKGKQNIVVSGANKLNLIYCLEMILGKSFNTDISTKDSVYGIKYDDITDCMLTFNNDSVIVGKGSMVVSKGAVPKVHCIRYSSGGTIRSYVFSDELCNANIGLDLTKYSRVLSDTDWYRLCALTNKFLGINIVDVKNEQLLFNFVDNYKYSIDVQKFVYLLFAECMLTPTGFSRVLLLGDIQFLSNDDQIRLIGYLSSIRYHSCIISTINISLDEVTNNISLLSI